MDSDLTPLIISAEYLRVYEQLKKGSSIISKKDANNLFYIVSDRK